MLIKIVGSMLYFFGENAFVMEDDCGTVENAQKRYEMFSKAVLK